MKLHLTPHEYEIVKFILEKYLPNYEVAAFGSRVTVTHKIYSDLDLCVITDVPLSLMQLANLREAFSESDLPMRVDIVDWSTLSSDFKKLIKKQMVVI